MSHIIAELSGLESIDNQVNKMEALSTRVMPPSLQCKDNTFLSEMQIAIFSSRSKKVRNCYILHQSI